MAARSTTPDVVSRVGDLLRGVGAHEPDGVSTSDLARSVGMPRPTAHRILSTLDREGLVDRDSQSGNWCLGPELYLLGTTAAARYDISGHAQAIVQELAKATAESAFLSARRGNETVCLIRQDGSFPLRSHVLHTGIRLPLGVASAGLAILAHLADSEMESYIRDGDLTPAWGATHSRAELRKRVMETRAMGYATNPGLLVEGSWGMGAAVFDRSGSPAWALSVTGVESRFRSARRAEVGRLLLDQAHLLTMRVQGS